MLSEKLLERYAEVLIWGLNTARKKKYRKGEIVRVNFDFPAIRLAEILQEKLIERGINPDPPVRADAGHGKEFLRSFGQKAAHLSGPRRPGALRAASTAASISMPRRRSHTCGTWIPRGSPRPPSPGKS